MRNFLSDLFLGVDTIDEPCTENSITRRIKNLRVIWNNEYHHDMGIERLIRLFLAVSQFIFLGTYVRFLGRKSTLVRDLSIDLVVLVKVAYSIICIKYHLYDNNFYFIILLWFMTETLLYIPTLIFASDYLARPRSYRRAILLFFFNYIEIVIAFASLYSKYAIMNKPFLHWFDAIYYSFVTSSSTGYGDFFPENFAGKFICVAHSITSLVFIVLFLNSFSSKMELTGYFSDEKIVK